MTLAGKPSRVLATQSRSPAEGAICSDPDCYGFLERSHREDSESYRVHGLIPSLGLEAKGLRPFADVFLRKVINVLM